MINKYKIDATDSYNWTVFKRSVAGAKSNTPGVETWKPVAYCKNLKMAVEFVYVREARRKTELLGLLKSFESALEEAVRTVVTPLGAA